MYFKFWYSYNVLNRERYEYAWKVRNESKENKSSFENMCTIHLDRSNMCFWVYILFPIVVHYPRSCIRYIQQLPRRMTLKKEKKKASRKNKRTFLDQKKGCDTISLAFSSSFQRKTIARANSEGLDPPVAAPTVPAANEQLRPARREQRFRGPG